MPDPIEGAIIGAAAVVIGIIAKSVHDSHESKRAAKKDEHDYEAEKRKIELAASAAETARHMAEIDSIINAGQKLREGMAEELARTGMSLEKCQEHRAQLLQQQEMVKRLTGVIPIEIIAEQKENTS